MAKSLSTALDLSPAPPRRAPVNYANPPGMAEPPLAPAAKLGGHMPALDGVRGLAILLVLLHHFVAQATATNRFEAVVIWFCSYGSLGVDLFFVLSGFLITGILYDARAEPQYFRNFYMRRVLRIFPLYYGVLAVVFFVIPLVPVLQGSEIGGLRAYQAWAWLYGVNVYLAMQGTWGMSYIEHFWSLAVEEHFYFVWPLAVWLLAARRRVLLGATLALAAASFGGRVVAFLAGVNPVALTVLTPWQLDALLLGGFFAVYLRRPAGEVVARRAVVVLALLGGTVLLLQLGLHRLSASGFPAVRALRGGAFHLLCTAVLLHALVVPGASLVGRFFGSRLMTWLGKYSYGLYVYHHFLSYYFTRHGTEFVLASAIGSHTAAVAIQAVAGIAASMAAAWLSYELFEKFFLRLKSRWPSSRRPVATGTC
jgi:peptidoglycan/LPS O-acetylase OafA/YrhL